MIFIKQQLYVTSKTKFVDLCSTEVNDHAVDTLCYKLIKNGFRSIIFDHMLKAVMFVISRIYNEK